MLVLSRHPGGQIAVVDKDTGEVIGTITLCCIIGNKKARLGFDFPDRYTFVRRELVAEDGRDAGVPITHIEKPFRQKEEAP